MSQELRKTGLEIVGDVPWGTHFCQFYQTDQDLLDILVPYFTEGLKNNEFCMWITSEPLGAEAARRAMAAALPDFENYLRRGQIEIVPYTDWYLKGGTFDPERVLNDWVRKLDEALAAGYEGLRLTGNTFWLEQKDWRAFTDYEAAVDGVIGRYRMLAVCTYSIDRCGFNEILDVIRNHRFALVRREGRWELVENAERKRAREDLKRLAQFPAENPNPILRVTPGGDVMYANGPARDLLERMGWKEKMPVPPDFLAIASEAEGREGAVEAEITCDRGRVYWFAAVRPAGESYINLYARDITERKAAEEAARRGREWLRVTLTSIGDAVIATDAEKRISFLNPVASALTGWPSEEALGRPVREVFRIINELTGQPAEDIFARVLTEQRAVAMANNTAVLARDGRVVPIEDSAAPILGADGGLEGVVLVFHDVTAKRQAQRALRESEARFRSVLDNSLDVVYRLNLQTGRYEYFSPASSAVYGFSPGEMMALDPGESVERVHPVDRSALEAALARISGAGKGRVECRWLNKAGDYRWLSTNMHITRDTAGRPLYRDGTVRDITESKRAEEALRESEEQLRALYASMTEGLVSHEVVYADGKAVDYVITDVNPAFERIIGISREAAVGRKATEFYGTGSAPYLDVYARVAGGGPPEAFETYFLPMQKHFAISVFSPGKGKFATVFSDITERKRAEEALRAGLQRFYTVLSSMYASILLVADDGRIEFANQAFCDLFDLKEPPAALTRLDSAGMIEKIKNGYLHPDKEVARITEIVRRGQHVKGEEIAMQGGQTCLRDFIPLTIDGKSHGRLWYHLDITERKKTEALRQALAEQERLKLGAAVEQASESVIMLDLDGTIRYVNAAFVSINRMPRDEAVGRSYFHLLGEDPAAAAIRESVAKGHAWHGKLTRPVSGGRPVELEVTISPATDPSGKVIGGLVTEKDVTQENALQRQVRQAQKMEALGTLAGGITHDFNNILGAIIINTEMALLDLELVSPRPKAAAHRSPGGQPGQGTGQTDYHLQPPERMGEKAPRGCPGRPGDNEVPPLDPSQGRGYPRDDRP